MKMQASPLSEHGQKLTKLLIKAAGLEGKRVQTLTCSVCRGEPITFFAQIIADEDEVSKAITDPDSCELPGICQLDHG